MASLMAMRLRQQSHEHIHNDATAALLCEAAQAHDALLAENARLRAALELAAAFIESGESSGHDFFEVREAWRNAMEQSA